MGEVVQLHMTTPAVRAIQACRNELANYLPPDSGVRKSECVARIRAMLGAADLGKGPHQASEVCQLALDVLQNAAFSAEQKLDLLLGIFESPAAVRFAAPDLPQLIYGDFDY